MILPTLLVIFSGAFQQAITGFGFGVFAISLLPLFMQMRQATALLSVLSVAMNLRLAIQYRRNVDWKLMLPVIFAGFIGQTISINFLFTLEEGVLKKLLGILLIAFAIFFAYFRQRLKYRQRLSTSLIIGFLSGLLNTFNIGGPPTVFYYYMVTKDKDSYLACLQYTFLITSLYGMALHIYRGNITVETLQYSLLGLLVILPAAWLGGKLFKHCSQEKVGTLVYGSIALLGVMQFVI